MSLLDHPQWGMPTEPDYDDDGEDHGDMEASTKMNWTTERPTEPGYYVFKHAACWPLWLVTVKMGRWQISENPAVLYVAGLPSATANSDMRNGPLSEVHGKWFGPIPEPQ